MNAFSQTGHDVTLQGFFVGAQSLWVTGWHGPAVIGNCFIPGSEGQKIQLLSVYPCADGKLVKFLFACLQRHLILVYCSLPRRLDEKDALWLQRVRLKYNL